MAILSYINACWGFGILLSSGVVRACLNIESEWGTFISVFRHAVTYAYDNFVYSTAFKIPFCIQWVWPPLLIALIWFAPESPFWLVRQERYADAEHSVRRLTTAQYFSEEDVKRNVAMKIHTTELEKNMSAGASYLDMFKGVDRRRTEVVSRKNSLSCFA